MSLPSLPSGYDVSKRLRAGRRDCQLTVGFDSEPGHIPRFLVQLHYCPPETGSWETIARIDHNETADTGHDIYQEGLHVDVARRSGNGFHLDLADTELPTSRGAIIRRCVEYVRREATYFVDVYEERRPPGTPPSWSDGGDPTRNLISANTVGKGMSRESVEEFITLEELTERLAEAEDRSPKEIERDAEDLELVPPWDGTVAEE